jgi:cytochrome oxidase Cu insertion factor (SCO1/SenC/PrrC family)
MNDRRRILKKLPVAILGSSLIIGGSVIARTSPSRGEARAVIDTGKRDAFPDVELTSHRGESFRFYDDLVHNKINLISLMSIRGEESLPVVANLAKIADILGDRLGSEVYINSVTRDPEHDTPERLREFAQKLGVADKAGWEFLTSSQHVTSALTTRLYRHEHKPQHDPTSHASNDHFKRKVDIVFYGNGGVGVWGTFPALIDANDAVGRIAWVMPSENLTGKPRKAGPRKLSPQDNLSHNRVA